MLSSEIDLSQEERDWGRVFAWIHRRAEYLRQTKKTSDNPANLAASGLSEVNTTSTKSISQRIGKDN